MFRPCRICLLNRLSLLIKNPRTDVSESPRASAETMSESSIKPAGDPVFVSTHWSVVLRASQPDSPEALAALTELCRNYWFPLYAYARRQGCDMHSAQDLTQGFFSPLASQPAAAGLRHSRAPGLCLNAPTGRR